MRTIKTKLQSVLKFGLLVLIFVFEICCQENYSSVVSHHTDNPDVYQLDTSWPALPKGFVLGNPTGLGIDTFGNIVVFHRSGRKWPLVRAISLEKISRNTISIFDPKDGKLIASWGANVFVMPHGLTVDRFNNIWVTDVGLNQVFKFNYDGKLLLRLGEEALSGNDSLHFNQPTDVAVCPDGSFYVSDGYKNSRIIKFSASGHFLFQWGRKGNGKGEFRIPHGVDTDHRGNVYVADRENHRIQIFDSIGKYIDQYTGKQFGRVSSVKFQYNTNNIVAVDEVTSWFKLGHDGSNILILDTSGLLICQIGRSGSYLGTTCWYHDVTSDAQGNVYVSDILGDRLQKFKKIIN